MDVASAAAGSPEPAAWLGMDIGGTKVALRAETPAGEVRERLVRWSGRGAASDLTRLADRGRPVAPAGPGRSSPPSASRCPPPSGSDDRVVVWPSRPEWVGLDVRRAMAELFPGTPVCWADNGDLAALAEAEAEETIAPTSCTSVSGPASGVASPPAAGRSPAPAAVPSNSAMW